MPLCYVAFRMADDAQPVRAPRTAGSGGQVRAEILADPVMIEEARLSELAEQIQQTADGCLTAGEWLHYVKKKQEAAEKEGTPAQAAPERGVLPGVRFIIRAKPRFADKPRHTLLPMKALFGPADMKPLLGACHRHIEQAAFLFDALGRIGLPVRSDPLIGVHQKHDRKFQPFVLDRLSYDLAVLKKVPPYAAISHLRRYMGYDEYLQEQDQSEERRLSELGMPCVSSKRNSCAGFWFVRYSTAISS